MQARSRIQSVVELAAVVSLPAAAAVALHRLGAHPRLKIDWLDLEAWLQVAPADDVVAASLRLVGLAAAYWIMATTALYVLARLTRVPAAIRAVEWVTLPVARRAADRAVALSLVGSSLGGHAGTALAAEVGQLPGAPPPPVAQLDAPDADGGTADFYEPTPAGDGQPAPGSPPPTPGPSAAESPAGAPPPASGSSADDGARARRTKPSAAAEDPGPEDRNDTSAESLESQQPDSTHEVVAGDNLWTMAEQSLTAAWDRAPSTAETAGYWRQLIDRNADGLRSGDPDLIHPGEVIHLPAIPAPDPPATPEEDRDD